MSERTMYDGINSDAPAIHQAFPDAAMVAGYINGVYAWSQAQWDLFPHAEHVTISVTASADEGDILDVETGDAAPAQCEAWIAKRKAAGLYRPTVYCNLATVPAVRAGTGAYVLGQDYDIWIADWDGTTVIPYPHAAAKQDTGAASWDVSVVYDAGWPHRTAPEPPPPPPADWTYGPPQHLRVVPGHHDFHASWAEPAGAPVKPDHYELWVYKGGTCDRQTLVDSYPRRETGTATSPDPGALEPGTEYTLHVSAFGKDDSRGRPDVFASARFTTGR